MKSPFRAVVASSCAVLTLAASACGAGGGTSSRDPLQANATATPAAQVASAPPAGADIVAITVDGEVVTPTGSIREVDRDQPVVLQITASDPGQLHVHSSPEQVIDYPAGSSEITVSFAIPGVVDVEDHALDVLIVQFEVS